MFLAPIRLIPTRVSLDLQDLIPRFETSQHFCRSCPRRWADLPQVGRHQPLARRVAAFNLPARIG